MAAPDEGRQRRVLEVPVERVKHHDDTDEGDGEQAGDRQRRPLVLAAASQSRLRVTDARHITAMQLICWHGGR